MGLSTRIGAVALGAVTNKARKGSFYATTPGYDSATGALCRSVRSPVLDLG